MSDLAQSIVSLPWTMVRLPFELMAGLAAPQRPAVGAETGAADAAAGAGPGLLDQVGNLAFGLLQLGVDTVYWAAGNAWQQQQGFLGWGPVQPPETGRRR